MQRLNLLIIICSLFFGCNNPDENKGASLEAQKPPITQSEKQANQLIKQYWNNFNYKDTTLISALKSNKTIIINYVTELNKATQDSASTSLIENLNNAEACIAMYKAFLESYKLFLNDPNSPFRNEELYILVLEHMNRSLLIDDLEKSSVVIELADLKKNRVGELATNFTVLTTNGRKVELYDIKADHTLLYFYNPDCYACKQATNQLNSSSILKNHIEQGTLVVLAVYPDTDLEVWESYHSYLPANWINSIDSDQKIVQTKLYHLRAIPTIYLLDKNKKVLMKDVDVKAIEQYFKIRSMAKN